MLAAIPRKARVHAHSQGDADVEVFRTTTEHGITNMTLRVKHGTLEDQGLILGGQYHNKIVSSMAGKGGRLYDTGVCHLP